MRLNVENGSFCYKKNVPVFENINFEVNSGEILAILGPNGAGKTTTIKLILGLQSINSGEVKINGFNIEKDFEKAIEKGGFVSAHWDGTTETEVAIKEKTKATIRCIPFNNPQEDGKCILTGKPSKERVLFAKAY